MRIEIFNSHESSNCLMKLASIFLALKVILGTFMNSPSKTLKTLKSLAEEVQAPMHAIIKNLNQQHQVTVHIL